MKKRMIALLLTLAAAVPLISCGRAAGEPDAARPVTLTVMGRKTDMEKSYLDDVFRLYEAATGNQLELIAYEDAEFEEKAAKQFANGKEPDIFLHFHNSDLNRFSVADHFYYLNEESWIGELTDSALAYCQDRDGNVLGLPFWESSVSGCYYNKTLLDSLGMKAASTQAEFDTLCQVLADIGYTPVCWPADGCSWMFQFGLDPIFADDPELLERLNRNEITYSDIPAVTDMVQWIADAAENGWFGPFYLEQGWSDIGPALSSGEAVMTFIWDTWFYTDFAPESQYTEADFALMPVFMNTADGGTYEGGNLNMMMVSKNSGQLETALEFLAFCAAPENYNAAFDGIPTVSCFRGQNTNRQSRMVTEAAGSVADRERVSTAASRIIGYSADDVMAAFDSLFRGKTDVAGCVRRMDEYRIEDAVKQGAEGFPDAAAGD